MNFTKESLRKHLLSLGVPLGEWGRGGAKTLEHLLGELKNRESILSGRERVIKTVALDVFYGNEKLREVCQVFIEGRTCRIRIRKLPFGSVGEKLRPRETVMKGLRRALKEELGLYLSSAYTIRCVRDGVLKKESGSYPGLRTVNLQARFQVFIPKRAYRPDGYFENQEDKTTYFEWVPALKLLRKAS